MDTASCAREQDFRRTCMTYHRAREPANLRRSREPRLPGLRCVARKMRPLRACAAERRRPDSRRVDAVATGGSARASRNRSWRRCVRRLHVSRGTFASFCPASRPSAGVKRNIAPCQHGWFSAQKRLFQRATCPSPLPPCRQKRTRVRSFRPVRDAHWRRREKRGASEKIRRNRRLEISTRGCVCTRGCSSREAAAARRRSTCRRFLRVIRGGGHSSPRSRADAVFFARRA